MQSFILLLQTKQLKLYLKVIFSSRNLEYYSFNRSVFILILAGKIYFKQFMLYEMLFFMTPLLCLSKNIEVEYFWFSGGLKFGENYVYMKRKGLFDETLLATC